MLKKIVLALDRGIIPKPALDIAVALALHFDSKLLLLGISDSESKAVLQVHPSHQDIFSLQTPSNFKDNYEDFITYPFYSPETAQVPLEKITINSVEDDELEERLSHLQKEVTGSFNHHKLPEGAVSFRVENGKLCRFLKELEEEERPDLIVLTCPPKEANIKRQIHFSTRPDAISNGISQILRLAGLPVLVVPQNLKATFLRELESETHQGSSRHYLGSETNKAHILVTLDGTKEAETALPLAAELAGKFNLSLSVLMVLPINSARQYLNPQTTQPFRPGTDRNEQYDFAYDYLCRIQEELIEEGIDCHRVLLQGKAEERILQYIEKTHPTLTVLATHARSKLEQLLSGSVAGKIFQASPGMVCLVPTNPRLNYLPKTEQTKTGEYDARERKESESKVTVTGAFQLSR